MPDLRVALRIRADLRQAIGQLDRLQKEMGQLGLSGERAGRGARTAATGLERSGDAARRAAGRARDARGRFIRVGDAAERAGRSARRGARGFDRMRTAASRAQRSIFTLRNALVSLGALAGGRAIVGSGLAVERLEQRFRFATGSIAGARRELEFLRRETDRLGINFREAGNAYSSLAAAARGTTLEGAAARDIFLAVAEASRVLQLSAAETGGALTAIQQIISKGRVSAEELRGQLGERLPGAFQIAARAMGVTTQELDKMLEQGELLSEEFLPKFARELRRAFADDVPEAAQSAQASFERLGNAIDRLAQRIANSGLVDLLADLAEAAETLLGLFSTPEPAQLTAPERALQAAQEQHAEVIQQAMVEGIRSAAEVARLGLGVTVEQIDAAALRLERAQRAVDAETPELYRAAIETEVARREAAGETEISQLEQTLRLSLAILEARLVGQDGGTAGPGPGPQEPTRTRDEIVDILGQLEGASPELVFARALDAARELRDELRQNIEELGPGHQDLLLEVDAVYERMSDAAQESYERQLREGQGFVGGMIDALEDLADTSDEAFDRGRRFAERVFGEMEDALVRFARTGKLEVGDLVDFMIDEFARFVIRTRITGPLFDAFGGFLDGLFPVAHSGAIAGQSGGRSRNIHPAAFIGAPRLHRGTFPGLRGDEIPTILRQGEGVFTPEQMAALGPAGGGAVIINFENRGTAQREVDQRVRLDPRGTVIDIVVDDIENGGPIRNAVRRTAADGAGL